MKKAWLIAVILLCGIVIGLLLRQREPQFDGKSFSFWFRQFYTPDSNQRYDPTDRDEALFAFRKMGTNVYPHLVKEYFSTPTIIGKLNDRLMRWLARNKKDSPPHVSPEQIQFEARNAVQSLKPSAETLLPLLNRTLQSETRNYHSALFLLGCVGEQREQAVPLLRKALKHPNPMTRRMAIQSLGWLGDAADAALPELLQLFQNSNQPDPKLIILLGNSGVLAKAAKPKLETFCIGNDWRRFSAAIALYQIDPGNGKALNVLTNLGTASRDDLQNLAWSFEESRKVPIEFILPLTTHADEMIRKGAIIALVKHSPESAVKLLKTFLESEDRHAQFWAASQLMQIDGADSDARRLFFRFSHNEYWSERAFEGLGAALPDAQEVISFLNFIVESDIDEKKKKAAEKTLKRIKIRELMQKEGWKDNSPNQ